MLLLPLSLLEVLSLLLRVVFCVCRWQGGAAVAVVGLHSWRRRPGRTLVGGGGSYTLLLGMMTLMCLVAVDYGGVVVAVDAITNVVAGAGHTRAPLGLRGAGGMLGEAASRRRYWCSSGCPPSAPARAYKQGSNSLTSSREHSGVLFVHLVELSP